MSKKASDKEKKNKKKNRSKRKKGELLIRIAAEQVEEGKIPQDDPISYFSCKGKEKIHQPENGRSPKLIDLCLDGKEPNDSVVSASILITNGFDDYNALKQVEGLDERFASVVSDLDIFEVDIDNTMFLKHDPL
ncbi:hypothetical protein Tco_0758811 [Tanacetum coccineum]